MVGIGEPSPDFSHPNWAEIDFFNLLSLSPYKKHLISEINIRCKKLLLYFHPDRKNRLPDGLDCSMLTGLHQFLQSACEEVSDKRWKLISEYGKQGWKSTWNFDASGEAFFEPIPEYTESFGSSTPDDPIKNLFKGGNVFQRSSPYDKPASGFEKEYVDRNPPQSSPTNSESTSSGPCEQPSTPQSSPADSNSAPSEPHTVPPPSMETLVHLAFLTNKRFSIVVATVPGALIHSAGQVYYTVRAEMDFQARVHFHVQDMKLDGRLIPYGSAVRPKFSISEKLCPDRRLLGWFGAYDCQREDIKWFILKWITSGRISPPGEDLILPTSLHSRRFQIAAMTTTAQRHKLGPFHEDRKKRKTQFRKSGPHYPRD
jgi:hypothetical protein